MQIYVIRPPGDNQGSDISDSLLATEKAGVMRGRYEINASASVAFISGEIVPYMNQNLEPGELYDVIGFSSPERAELESYSVGISASQDGETVYTKSVALEAPIDR